MSNKQRSVEEMVGELIIYGTATRKEKNENGDQVGFWLVDVEEVEKLLKAERQKQEELVEEVAKAIYDQFSYTKSGVKPEWVENGNSLKQDEARALARKALTQPNNPK